MVRALVVLAIVGLTLSTAALIALLILSPGSPPGTQPSANTPAAFDLVVPEFTLTDQDGEPVDHTILEGEWTVLDFMFTSCPIYCPGMTNVMRHVQTETQGTPLRFASISIDGGYDDPAVLHAYADNYGADLDRWTFMTGPRAQTWHIATEGLGFHVGLSQTQTLDRDGTADAFIDHPTRLLLIGPDRTVAGMYRYDDPEEVARLIVDAKRLTQPTVPSP